ncbi:YciI family protein [Tropicimonas marinistellae]|uniref:YciI family protein n=1 Tax=Tropicimonas marinistellae TaxID=1739787 RepID=UPI000834AE63|nr:YciI family protein [Tropicimonas marinistellae]
MPKYVFAYHGGKKPESAEEGAKVMAEWQAWYEGMGASVVDGGNPVGKSYTVHSGGVDENGGANPLSGYTLINADDYESAIAHAKGCPMVKDGSGSVEVAEAIDM